MALRLLSVINEGTFGLSIITIKEQMEDCGVKSSLDRVSRRTIHCAVHALAVSILHCSLALTLDHLLLGHWAAPFHIQPTEFTTHFIEGGYEGIMQMPKDLFIDDSHIWVASAGGTGAVSRRSHTREQTRTVAFIISSACC